MQRIWVAGTILLACTSVAAGPKTSQTSMPKNQGQASEGYHPTSDSPLPVQIIQTPVAQAAAGEKESKAYDQTQRGIEAAASQAKTAKWQLWLSIFGGALLLATLFETRRTAKAAIKSAAAAEKQLTHTQRAFLAVKLRSKTETASGSGTMDVTGIRIDAKWTNRGATPSRHTIVHVCLKRHTGKLPDEFPFGEHLKGHRYEVDIAPGLRRNIGHVIIEKADAEKAFFAKDDFRLYLFGRAEYRDVFDDTEVHYTTFCMRVKVGAYTAAKGYEVKFLRHDEYNQTT